jgi:enterochelin esterase-like enzyme/outer membrane protein assembly factor BamB
MRPSRILLFSALLTACCGLLVHAESGDDWPGWSGPNRNLTATSDGLFQREAFGLERVWSRPLGSGYSGLTISGHRVVAAFSDGDSDFVAALDSLSGEELWRYRIGELYPGHEGSNDGPLATPTIRDGRVFALGPRGRLFALGLDDGREVWSRQLVEEYGAREPLYGFTSAPTIIDDVLVLQTGGADGHGISGFEPATGRPLWSTGDDEVSYQSPAAVRVGNEELVFSVTNRRFVGLAPRTGAVLWSHEHPGENGRGFSETQALALGEGRVLLAGSDESALFRVEKNQDAYRAVEVWRSRALYGSLATPVPHGGHLYGYSGRRFLTCVDARNGETVWKSREPGTGNLVLVDGHLVILAPSGDLVVAVATPEGYRERARVKALDRGGLTWPSFAGGRVFVRNLTEIASIAVTDKPAATVARDAEEPPVVELHGQIEELVSAAQATENRNRVIEEFFATNQTFPILEGEDLVHFVFRGEVEDLRLVGNMRLNQELPLHRIEGTDVYVRSMTLQPDARFEYAFAVFDDEQLDLLNSRSSAIDGQERSVLTTRNWKEPAHLAQPSGPRGRIEKLDWKSEILGNEREVRVYLPPGYDDSTDRYPLLVVANGDEALEWGLLDRSLDNLIGSSVAPLIVACVPILHFTELGSLAPKYADGLTSELIPRIDQTYRTLTRADARGLFATRWAGAQSLYVAWTHQDVFGKLAAQSLETGALRDQMLAMIETGEKCDLVLYLEWSLNGYEPARSFGQELVTALEEKQCSVTTNEIADGIGWGGWREHTDRILETLFPLE